MTPLKEKKMKELDARGLVCPAPVIQTKAEVEENHQEAIKVIVDNEAAKQNVNRFLQSQNYETSIEEAGEDFHVFGKISGDVHTEISTEKKSVSASKKIMMMVASNKIGHGDDELGLKLMTSFIKTLKEMGPELWRLVFVNSGVKLVVEDSEVLADLKELEAEGLQIMACGACLTHFNLMAKKSVGETTNMLDIVTSMQLADKVVNI
jgi:selenium metabolism protein YedF